jgi:catechol 2,3-dioxygenase-like lactoylglutathione lyase family enzyme
MLTTARITAFAATARAAAARDFYQQTLGLQLRSEDEFAIVFNANGIELRIQKVDAVVPHGYTALGWNVPDLHQLVRDLVARGVAFEKYPFLQQAADGIWTAPNGAKVAWFKDPDGNLLSIAEYDAA